MDFSPEFFKFKRNGFFVDIGAHDGISHSNSYFFEKYLKYPNKGLRSRQAVEQVEQLLETYFLLYLLLVV